MYIICLSFVPILFPLSALFCFPHDGTHLYLLFNTPNCICESFRNALTAATRNRGRKAAFWSHWFLVSSHYAIVKAAQWLKILSAYLLSKRQNWLQMCRWKCNFLLHYIFKTRNKSLINAWFFTPFTVGWQQSCTKRQNCAHRKRVLYVNFNLPHFHRRAKHILSSYRFAYTTMLILIFLSVFFSQGRQRECHRELWY